MLKFAPLRVGAVTATGLLLAASAFTAPVTQAAPGSVAGMIVFLDPGHNGANDDSITRQVSNGRGGSKDCQASGTNSESGYPEHTFTWDTTLRIRQALHALGVRTAMSRGSPPLNQAQAGPSVQFARTMREALAGSGIPPATYIGSNGLNPRADIAGLNLAQYPSILVELGNMKNPVDSTLMESEEGRQKYADAVARGVVAFLLTQPPRTT
ncbi:MAG: N-acetylmuramoyl-L-alanine amidase [Mycobacterium sp.]|nr:N-acetylmuramoyl-L-alanine amidase [Mycobacterium sp.]